MVVSRLVSSVMWIWSWCTLFLSILARSRSGLGRRGSSELQKALVLISRSWNHLYSVLPPAFLRHVCLVEYAPSRPNLGKYDCGTNKVHWRFMGVGISNLWVLSVFSFWCLAFSSRWCVFKTLSLKVLWGFFVCGFFLFC